MSRYATVFNIGKATNIISGMYVKYLANTIQRFRLNWGAGGKRLDSGEDHSIFVGDLSADVTDDILLATFTARFSSVRGAKVDSVIFYLKIKSGL